MVYNKLTLPIANAIIQNIWDTIKNYTLLNYEDFKENIKDLADTAREHHNMASYTMSLYTKLLADFKSSNNDVKVILEKFKIDKKWLKNKQNF